MTLAIIIFFISILLAFGMLAFRAWEIKTNRKTLVDTNISLPEFPFRHLEKNMLYLTKHILQWIVIISVKYWFVTVIKIKKIIVEDWPKVHNLLKRKPKKEPGKMSFAKRAILESKFKIKRMKEKIKEDMR